MKVRVQLAAPSREADDAMEDLWVSILIGAIEQERGANGTVRCLHGSDRAIELNAEKTGDLQSHNPQSPASETE